jgi:hypothetical protein
MGSRLTEIVVDCHDPVAQAAFWAAALEYHVVHTENAQVEIAPWEQEPADLAEQVRQAPSEASLGPPSISRGWARRSPSYPRPGGPSLSSWWVPWQRRRATSTTCSTVM